MTGRDCGRAPRPVVVGVDGSQSSARALAWALREARDRHAPVRVVTAWAWGDGTGTTWDTADAVRQIRQVQEALVRAVLARFPGVLPDLSTELVQGDPATTLIERSSDGVLLVLGSQGLRGAADTVGSVADNCLRHGSCPVVVVPPDPAARRGPEAPGRPCDPPLRAGLAPVAVAALGLL